jgi:hypothetical protein
MSVNT